jgi:alpha-L-fucosidase
MIVREYIKEFEKLGFGMFVHFGAYSLIEKGEWVKEVHRIPDEEYFKAVERFNPDENWAKEWVSTAKAAGCKYITLTTRHHDGFSLFDTCGLNTYDAPHVCGRDVVREFVDECNAQGIIPFFYHTLLDWWHKDFHSDFKAYLAYLRASVELLCKNYGKIGGIWFDGMWSKKDEDW